MSDLTETEILDRHVQSLKEARDHCTWLGAQADPDNAWPRGRRYAALQRAVKELEGSARQMAHWRGDARWLRLGILYAKAGRSIQAWYIAQKWLDFGRFSALFAHGLRTMDDLATGKTGRTGAILPTNTSDWLILPDHDPMNPSRGIDWGRLS